MKIEFVDIQNFRKLKSCRIDLTDRETVFVGANNSGKTSAMDALITFFKNSSFTTRDFTLSNWKAINNIGSSWINTGASFKPDFSITLWEESLPTLDIWLDVKPTEIHYVNNFIPTLDWTAGSLGVRLRYEPKSIESLYKEFMAEIVNSASLLSNKSAQSNFKPWPKDMWDFLDRDKMLLKQFEIKCYVLDPSQKTTQQKLDTNALPLEMNVLKGLIKVDIINAQRGFSDVNSDVPDSSRVKSLSSQLRLYYDKHLSPSTKPTTNDLQALQAIEEAREMFDKNLKESFRASLEELENLNYPGFGNPTINLSSRLNAMDTINHEAAVQYILDENLQLSLPEKYNGLGYQNLISMIFKLIRFRDEWMQHGKSMKTNSPEEETIFEPLHLVLIEEPEAHLHAQVQQVFISEAYKVLRNHKNLGTDNTFTTQLVISTHSNHIAHEIEFTSLRYFKRNSVKKGEVSTSCVVNLSQTFGTQDETTRFAIRYLKTTHCDIFFADAVILVEGPAEKMLVPYFIKQHSNTNLKACYISILEIGGSHAHTLRPLIESIGIITLIITDIDAADPKSNMSKKRTEKGKCLVTGNDTIRKWLPAISEIDKLLNAGSEVKVHSSFPVRIAYQIPVTVSEGNANIEVNPYTFEDCLVLENRLLFQSMGKRTGLFGKMIFAASEQDFEKSATQMYEAITETGAKKAEFALDLLLLQEPSTLKIPTYIKEGLDWLETKLLSHKQILPLPKSKSKSLGTVA